MHSDFRSLRSGRLLALLFCGICGADAFAAEIRNGKLVVQAHDELLSTVADDITQATQIPIITAKEIAEARISVVVDAPVDAAIRQAFSNFDVFCLYGSEAMNRSALQIVWVYPKGRGRSIQPTPKEEWASTKEMENQIADEDPRVRVRAYETLIQRKGPGALSMVVTCLQRERDEMVRTRVLYTATRRGVPIPPNVLTFLVASDSSETIRLISLEALQTTPEIAQIAANAMYDTSPTVRQRAREILDAANASRGAGEQGRMEKD